MSAVPDDGSEPNITLVHRDGGHAQDAAGGSFQVPDSDNDESLEELAALQEQEYWSMLGIEEQEQQQDHEDDEQTAVDAFSSSPRSITPFVTSRRASSKTASSVPDDLREDSHSPLPSISELVSPQRDRSRSFSMLESDAGPQLHRITTSMSPDPLALPENLGISTIKHVTLPKIVNNADEGYQTKTDSDHVTSVEDVSVEPEEVNEVQVHVGDMAKQRQRSQSPSRNELDDLPPPLASRAEQSTPRYQSMFSSSPLTSPAHSPESRHVRSPIKSASPLPPITLPQQDVQVQRETSTASLPDSATAGDDFAPVRQFRQRKAVQLAPYSLEFSKFASIASKNQWEGVISAGMRQAFAEKEKHKKDGAEKRQRDPSDEWLVHGNEEEEDEDPSFSEPSSEPTSPRRKRRGTSLSDPDSNRQRSKSVERYSRTHKEKEWDPVANRLKAANKTSAMKKGTSHRNHRQPYASTSKTTIEDLDRSSSKKLSSDRGTYIKMKKKDKRRQDDTVRRVRITQAQMTELLPSDVDSSSSDKEQVSARRERHKAKRQQLLPARDHHAQATPVRIWESSSSEPDSDGPPGSDSPDRPIASRKERFTLKGKRKRAAMFMMPAVALKKAEADLKLMEREMEEGKQIRLEELDADNAAGEIVNSATKAKKRWAPQNADRPFRYVTELSTSESESEPDNNNAPQPAGDDETQAAMQTWSYLAAGKSQTSAASREHGYWDKVIGRILVRNERDKNTRSRRRPGRSKIKNIHKSKSRSNEGTAHQRNLAKSSSRSRQTGLHQHFSQPVYLDSADRLFESIRTGPSAIRPPTRVKASREAFWQELAGSGRGDKNNTSEAPRQQAVANSSAKTDAQAQKAVFDDTSSASKFARFSFDFDIDRLPSEISFGASTYIGKGHLLGLINMMKESAPRPAAISVTPFGIGLDDSIAEDVLLQLLPRLTECMYEYAIGEHISATLDCPIGQSFRFLCHYASRLTNPSSTSDCRAAIFEALKSLEARLDQTVAEVDSLDQALSTSLVSFRWAMLEASVLAYAKGNTTATSSAKEASRHRILEDLGHFVTLLLQSGSANVAKAVRQVTADSRHSDIAICMNDIYCEAWVSIINICKTGEQGDSLKFLSLSSLWRIVEHSLKEEAIQRHMHPIVRGETASHTVMSLCALSQFGPDGTSHLQPSLKAYWPLIAQTLENVQVQELPQAYSAMSTSNRTRISRYIWTIFARFLNMANRWHWPLLEQGKLLGKLFDILNSRQLEDFCIDGEADFPAFMSSFKGQISSEIDVEDTTFHLFLRLLAHVAAEAREQDDVKSKNVLARIAMRIMPMRENLPYPRHASGVKPLDRSILVNHCALLTVLAAIDPSTSERRFAKLKSILDFEKSDTRARQDYLKAIMFMGVVYKVLGIELSPILSWLTHTADYLCKTYTLCAKRRAGLLLLQKKNLLAPKSGNQQTTKEGRKVEPAPKAHLDHQEEILRINREMGETAVMEGLLLGAVQHIMTTQAMQGSVAAMYPSLQYLSSSWTTQVLSSPMGRDPVAGSQVLQCIRKFIKLRDACMDHIQASMQGESQDEFADMDFDYDDPALNAMLGLPDAQNAANEREDDTPDVRKMDAQFIELLKTSISPRLYSTLSDLVAINAGHDSGVPEFPNKKAYIADVVETWASSAAILVQKNQRDWNYYIGTYGKESWQRIADILGRFEIGGIFCATLLGIDSKAYKNNRSTLLEVLFRRMAAPVPSTFDATLLMRLLNADPSFLLLQNLPFQLEELVEEYVFNLDDLMQARTAVFRAIFANCKKILAKGVIIFEDMERSCAAVCREQNIEDQMIYSLLGYMLSTFRDFLDASGNGNGISIAQKQYAAFCRQIIFILKEELGPSYATEQHIPALRLLAGIINGTVS